MKTVTLLTLITALATASGFLIKVPTAPAQPKTAPTGWVHLQKLILPLFENVCEDSTNPIIVRLAQEFSLESSSGVYLKPDALVSLKNFKNTKGLLAKGEIFSEYNTEHLTELRLLYEVLYYAKDFSTFYEAAAWARQNVNCGLFVDAIYLAILKRRDTEMLSVPAPYELLPNYFIRKDVVIKGSTLLSGEVVTPSEDLRDVGNSYIIDADYTTSINDDDGESNLAYFHEDISINTYYFLQKLKLSPWFNMPPNTNIRYGEELYYTMKQLSTRYNLERYSNGLPEVEPFDINSDFGTTYDPMLIYSNGEEFGHRTTSFNAPVLNDIDFLKNIESNIGTVLNHMKQSGYNKTETLNHLMEILTTGDQSYENTARRLTGKDVSYNNSQPSVLEHYMTTVRDPLFWKLNKKIVDLVDEALKTIPSYTRSELFFPGIEVLNVDVKKMMTIFDYFQIDVTNSLKSENSSTTFQVKVEQPRLNHKPFAVKLNISSFVTEKGLVKIFLGPKVAPGEFTSKKNQFMLLDSFEYKFKIGPNVITRTSNEMNNLAKDFPYLTNLRTEIQGAEFGLDILPIQPVNSLKGFPSRLILPKGTPEGLPLQIFVFVAPFIKTGGSGGYLLPNTDFNSAILSPGYPLDLHIDDSQLFVLPNTMLKDIIITHKGDGKLSYKKGGEAEKWQSNSYDPSSRPDYSSKRKEPYDYSSKQGQYGKKEDYMFKRGEYNKGNKNNLDENQNIEILNSNNNYSTISIEDINHESTDVTPSIENYTQNLRPLLRMPFSKKRTPTVFDYLLPNFDFNDDDDDDNRGGKVYE